MSRAISKVNDSNDKYVTYKRYMEKYSNALKYECYLEAIAIDYAMIEDRLLAFLHIMGVISRDHDKLAVNKFCRAKIRVLLNRKPNAQLGVTSISGKLSITKALLSINAEEKDKYLSTVNTYLEKKILKQEFCETIAEIEKWCKIRNEYIHALLNKNYDSAQEGIKEYAEEGLKLARKVDSYVKKIKRNNNIRKSFNIQ